MVSVLDSQFLGGFEIWSRFSGLEPTTTLEVWRTWPRTKMNHPPLPLPDQAVPTDK